MSKPRIVAIYGLIGLSVAMIALAQGSSAVRWSIATPLVGFGATAFGGVYLTRWLFFRQVGIWRAAGSLWMAAGGIGTSLAMGGGLPAALSTGLSLAVLWFWITGTWRRETAAGSE